MQAPYMAPGQTLPLISVLDTSLLIKMQPTCHKIQFLGFSYLHVVEPLSTLKPNREKEAQRCESVTLKS